MKDYTKVSGGWGSVWVAPENLWVHFCEGSLLLGWRVGKCGMNCVLPFCCFCRGLVVWGKTHSDLLPGSCDVQEQGGWSESNSVWMDVVTAAEKLGDWRVTWMCCSISAGRFERDWFSNAVTAVSKACFAGRFSEPKRRDRASTSA